MLVARESEGLTTTGLRILKVDTRATGLLRRRLCLVWWSRTAVRYYPISAGGAVVRRWGTGGVSVSSVRLVLAPTRSSFNLCRELYGLGTRH